MMNVKEGLLVLPSGGDSMIARVLILILIFVMFVLILFIDIISQAVVKHEFDVIIADRMATPATTSKRSGVGMGLGGVESGGVVIVSRVLVDVAGVSVGVGVGRGGWLEADLVSVVRLKGAEGGGLSWVDIMMGVGGGCGSRNRLGSGG